MRSVLAIILLALVVGLRADLRVLQATSLCPNTVPSYILYAIDARIQGQVTSGCVYRVYLSNGQCSIGTAFASPNGAYICYYNGSSTCSSDTSSALVGFATSNCNGTYKTENFPSISNYSVGQEYTMSTSFLNAQVAVGYTCNSSAPTVNATGQGWTPRSCTPGAPSPGGGAQTGTSFAMSMETGVMLMVLVLMAFMML